MTDSDWYSRFVAAIDANPLSDRALSAKAGLGANFVNQMRSRKRVPNADAVISLCAVLDVSLAYVFIGTDLTPQAEELIRRFSALPDAEQQAYLALLRARAEGAATPPGPSRAR